MSGATPGFASLMRAMRVRPSRQSVVRLWMSHEGRSACSQRSITFFVDTWVPVVVGWEGGMVEAHHLMTIAVVFSVSAGL